PRPTSTPPSIRHRSTPPPCGCACHSRLCTSPAHCGSRVPRDTRQPPRNRHIRCEPSHPTSRCTQCIDALSVCPVKEQHAPPGADRREALRARYRRAILDAAADLMDQSEGAAFTVDTLAERADVSRRTVFNHFASVEDIVIEVFSEVLSGFADHIDA